MTKEAPATVCDLDTTVPDWIVDHPETLSVFQGVGIDVSCGGKSLGYVCDQQGLDRKLVLETLHRKIKTSATVKGRKTDGHSPCEAGRRD